MKHCTTIGIDLGDKKHQVCILDRNGGELESSRISNTPEAIEKCLAGYPGAVVSMEAGTHSPWVSRLIEKMGHKVYVANPRKTRLICDTDDKTDVRDARMLAKIARFDVSMLYPI